MSMAIELYDDLNYLLVLDHYDDITLFDLDAEPIAVSYYQMKTSENTITIDSAIKENWIAKLYKQLDRSENWLVEELGLITNTPLEITVHHEESGKISTFKERLNSEKTRFNTLNQDIQDRIKHDIATKCNVDEKDVDLSKFAHLRTKLTITGHRELVEQKMTDFLYSKYPSIQVNTVKGIFAALITLLSQRQAYETLSDNASLDEVRRYKGFTRDELNRVIEGAIVISIPDIDEVIRFLGINNSKLSLAWVQLVSDSKKKSGSFDALFKSVRNTVLNHPFKADVKPRQYVEELSETIIQHNPILCAPYSKMYLCVLISCLLINEQGGKNEKGGI